MVTGGALVSAFGLKSIYRLLTRVTSPYSQLGVFLVDHVMVAFNWSSVGIVYQTRLGVRALRHGKSSCYFTVEGIYTAMQSDRGVRDNTRKIWRKAFDPEGPGGLNVSGLLREVEKKTRST